MFLCIFFSLISCITASIVNVVVVRNIDITTQTVKEKAVVVFKNPDDSPVRTYTFFLTPETEDYFIEFTNAENQQLLYSENVKEKNVFTVYLDKIVEKNDTYKIVANTFSATIIKPRFKKITWFEKHVVFYSGNVYFYSPYKTLSLQVKYACKANSSCYASYLPHSQIDNTLFYSYLNVVPYSVKEMNISFIHDEPLFAVTDLERTVDVSHWGQILIEDRVTLKNIGDFFKLILPNNSCFACRFCIRRSIRAFFAVFQTLALHTLASISRKRKVF